MISHTGLLKRLDAAASDVGSYQGGDSMTACVALLDALLAMYLQDLCDVAPDKLQRLQGYVQQLQELRGVMSGEVKTNGRL